MAKYMRNIQGVGVELELLEVDPREIRLDPANPRIGFSISQLPPNQRTEEACELLLISQEETESLKLSILASGGVQEPIYLRANGVVAEGNRRVVALRAAAAEKPQDRRFASLPAWRIPDSTPEPVVQNLLNEIHIGSIRGWAPYEKALQLRALYLAGLTESEIAERYRVTAREVRQQLDAVETMERHFLPVTEDPTDPEHRSKFSYFLEFEKNGRIQEHGREMPGLRRKFSEWVRDGRIDTGARVRRLPRILSSAEATRLLEVSGAEAAEEFLARSNPQDQELYAVLERARSRVRAIGLRDLKELRESPPRQAIVRALYDDLGELLDEVAAGAE
jgi:hypothetical protein